MEYVAIPFEADTPFGLYKDTLWFPADQVPSAEEIERLKQERIDRANTVSAGEPEVPSDG